MLHPTTTTALAPVWHTAAVVGEVCSAATVAAAGVAASRGLLLISPAASSPTLTDRDLFFRTVPSDKFQGQAGADLAYKKGVRTVAMVYEDASYGYGLAFSFIAGFTKGAPVCCGVCVAGCACVCVCVCVCSCARVCQSSTCTQRPTPWLAMACVRR
jgi:hypothetical protein